MKPNHRLKTVLLYLLPILLVGAAGAYHAFATDCIGSGCGGKNYINSGSVGIGTATPQSLLQAYGGEVQVGSSGVSCTSTNAGALRFSSPHLYLCNGSAWTSY